MFNMLTILETVCETEQSKENFDAYLKGAQEVEKLRIQQPEAQIKMSELLKKIEEKRAEVERLYNPTGAPIGGTLTTRALYFCKKNNSQNFIAIENH